MSGDHFRTDESRGGSRAEIRTLEMGRAIDLHFVGDATAEVGLNDYVYGPQKRRFAANVHPYRETSRNVVPIDSYRGCVRD